MAKSPSNGVAFIIQILDTQNATWQGTVTWTDSREEIPFRSELELIRLIDSAVNKKLM